MTLSFSRDKEKLKKKKPEKCLIFMYSNRWFAPRGRPRFLEKAKCWKNVIAPYPKMLSKFCCCIFLYILYISVFYYCFIFDRFYIIIGKFRTGYINIILLTFLKVLPKDCILFISTSTYWLIQIWPFWKQLHGFQGGTMNQEAFI